MIISLVKILRVDFVFTTKKMMKFIDITLPILWNVRAIPLGVPLPTVTTRDRFEIVGTDGLELGFRMLQPTELAAATGFPSNYKFTGTKVEIVKQIGNAVPPNFAKALFATMLKEEKKQEYKNDK